MDLYRWLVALFGNAGAVANAGDALEVRRQEERVVDHLAASAAA
jgi:hypothetical protein